MDGGDDAAARIADGRGTCIGDQRDARSLLEAADDVLRGLYFVVGVCRKDVRANAKVGQ